MPDDRLRKLYALEGEWETTITMLNADGSDGEQSKASDIYRWAPNRQFLLHDVDAEMGGERAQSMEIIALDPAGSGYISHSYDPDGSVNNFTAALEGKSWRITGEVQRFAGTFSDDGKTLSGRWEQNNNGSWAPLMTVVLRRQA